VQPVGNIGAKIGVDVLFDLKGADKAAKAYAFLYAAFRRTEISSAPVRDALDCLTPFIAPYLNRNAGSQVDLSAMQEFLKSNFGFDIPLYALEQILPALQQSGFLEYNKPLNRYFAKKHESSFDIAKSDIEMEFDEVSDGLSSYAKSLGFQTDPPSGSWGDALIAFLKTYSEKQPSIVTKLKGALLDPNKVETSIVGSFLRNLHVNNPRLFQNVVHIFMGVLIEEFISSVSGIGTLDAKNPVIVFYDTAVLLRLLGSSGRMLRTASEELTRYLQDIGFKVYYFSGNEAEVANIFNTIIYVKDTGRELEGETAEAVSNGEITITDLRMLQNTFPERLAQLSVFPAETFERDAQKNAQFQIDEKGFSEYLLQQANTSKRAYGAQNRANDASYLGNVMRLRRNNKTRDLADSKFIFVTSNKFLASTSRRYLIEQRTIFPQHCPPILSVGQIATIAWLLKDQSLAPEKAGRELLSNCFAAVRPDAEVITHRHFRRADRDEALDFRAPLPGSPISESMCAWIALICSA
jgi:hypothetical protein